MRLGRAKAWPVLLLSAGMACTSEKPALSSRDAADVKRPADEWLQLEPVRLLRDYVRVETTARKGERAGAEFLRRFFECEGIDVEIVCPAPERCNVLARLPGASREGSLLLLNHIDVVDAFPEFWKEAPPFDGRIKNGSCTAAAPTT